MYTDMEQHISGPAMTAGKLTIAFIAVLAVGATGFGLISGEAGNGETKFRTATIDRGNVLKSVSASGELNAVVTVEVGSEISGQISEMKADFNSVVRAGQVIARIDPESLEAKVEQSAAELAVAEATVATRKAALFQARANRDNARATLAAYQADVERATVNAADLEREYDRKALLRERGVVAVSVVDSAKAAYDSAVAQIRSAKARLAAHRSTVAARNASVSVAEAEIVHAGAQVQQKRAALNIAMVNLDNTFIRSPVDGVVIGRNVDIGQTVAASLQAPTLFTIARDLRDMQVETNIDEADIGQIAPGQVATFTVDSFAGRNFQGTVTQVRKQPRSVQNVVTYTVVINVDNADLRLLPGMTATVEVKVSDRTNVLRIPNTALRFTPPGEEQIAATGAAPGGPRGPGARGPRGDPQARRAAAQKRMNELAEFLGLSEEQKSQVRDLNRQMVQRMRAMRQAGGGPELRETLRKMRRDNSQKILALLNPAQQQKFRARITERRANPATPAHVWILEDGEPKRVQVFIGVGDGKSTEMVRGPLQEGDVVLTGINRSAEAGSNRFFRFGL